MPKISSHHQYQLVTRPSGLGQNIHSYHLVVWHNQLLTAWWSIHTVFEMREWGSSDSSQKESGNPLLLRTLLNRNLENKGRNVPKGEQKISSMMIEAENSQFPIFSVSVPGFSSRSPSSLLTPNLFTALSFPLSPKKDASACALYPRFFGLSILSSAVALSYKATKHVQGIRRYSF